MSTYLIFKRVGENANILAASVASSPEGSALAWKVEAPVAAMHIAQKALRPHWAGGNLYSLSEADVHFLLRPKFGHTVVTKRWLLGLRVGLGIVVGLIVLITLGLRAFWYGLLALMFVTVRPGFRR